MLNLSILDGWEDLHWLEDYHLAKAATITGELLRLRCVTKGKRGTVLVLTASAGTPCRKKSKKQSTQSTMKQGVKEYMIRHKQILKKVNFKDTEKVKLKNTFSRKVNEKQTPGNYVRSRYFT